MKIIIRYLRMRFTNSKLVNWTEEEYAKFIDGIKSFLEKVSKEASETKEASVILKKYIKEGKVTPEEEEKFREQLIDVLKAMGIGIPFVLIPGASLLLPLVAKLSKKFKINIFPSSFNNKQNDERKSE